MAAHLIEYWGPRFRDVRHNPGARLTVLNSAVVCPRLEEVDPEETAFKVLGRIKDSAPGPDGNLYSTLRCFAKCSVPIVTDVNRKL